MLNLNESNRIVMSQHPSDMRVGVNGRCGQVRLVGQNPADGYAVYDYFEEQEDVTQLGCMGKAMDYAYKLLPRLRRYTLDGDTISTTTPWSATSAPQWSAARNTCSAKVTPRRLTMPYSISSWRI